MLVVAAVVIAGSEPDGGNGAVVVGKNVVAIYLPPLVTLGWTPVQFDNDDSPSPAVSVWLPRN